MKRIIFPKYYKDFKCRADLCKNNCCIGWEIDIDDKTLKKYLSLGGALGAKIKENIAKTGGVSHFLMKNGRCPFLNEHNLCEIITELGDGALCDICREIVKVSRKYTSASANRKSRKYLRCNIRSLVCTR